MVYCRHAMFMSLWLYMYCGSPHIKPVAVGKYCMVVQYARHIHMYMCVYMYIHVVVAVHSQDSMRLACTLQLFCWKFRHV